MCLYHLSFCFGCLTSCIMARINKRSIVSNAFELRYRWEVAWGETLVLDVPFYLFSSETLLIFFPDIINLSHTSGGSSFLELPLRWGENSVSIFQNILCEVLHPDQTRNNCICFLQLSWNVLCPYMNKCWKRNAVSFIVFAKHLGTPCVLTQSFQCWTRCYSQLFR